MTDKRLPSFSSFDRKNLSAAIIIGFVSLMFVGGAVSQSSSGYDVDIGANGVDINSGKLHMSGNDIVSGATTIWDASAGQIPNAAINAGGLTWSDLGISQSDVSKSDVGLGNVENENAFAQNGSESMNGDLDLSSNALNNVGYISSGGSSSSAFGSGTEFGILAQGENALVLGSQGDVALTADTDSDDGGYYTCTLDSTDGSWDCQGTKNWIHDLGNGSVAYYTSQESPMVRAVYEGKAHVVDSKKVKLPSHFTKTVSNTKPMLRAQVTPQGTFTKAVVMDKTDDYIEIKVGKETDVNFRITGIREGYENKDVVRPKK